MLKSIGFKLKCFRSSVVERILGKDEVKSSILFGSFIISLGSNPIRGFSQHSLAGE